MPATVLYMGNNPTADRVLKVQKLAHTIRRDIIDISYRAHVGHIGSALSIADIMAAVYGGVLRITPATRTDPRRDRFILSKGHAAAALYSVLYRRNLISRKVLNGFCSDGGALSVHPDYNPQFGIELTTGSLGHGLSVGSGMAFVLKQIYGSGFRMYGKKKSESIHQSSILNLKSSIINLKSSILNHKSIPYVYVLISDAELNEGSVWEAIMYASHHKLFNLIVIVDNNGQQAFGKTSDVISNKPVGAKFRSFGWQVTKVSGHDAKSLLQAFSRAALSVDRPTVIIAGTISGYGIPFMQGSIDWHYRNLDRELYQKAKNHLRSLSD